MEQKRRMQLRRLYDRARILLGMIMAQSKGEKPFPFFVNLVVNSWCNLHCQYCFGGYSARSVEEPSFEELRQWIDEFAAMGTRFILVQGGETLGRKDLGSVLRYIRDKGIVVAIVTNGTLVAKRADNLPELALCDNICFSLDGNKEGNDKNRGDGVFDMVMEAIRVVRSRFDVPVRTHGVLTSNTINDVPFLAEFGRTHNILVQVSFLYKDPLHPSLVPSDGQIRAAALKLAQYKKSGYPLVASSSSYRYAAEWPCSHQRYFLNFSEADILMGHRKVQCQYGRYMIVLDADGRLYPCNALQGVFDALNVRDAGIARAYDHVLMHKPCFTCYQPGLLETSQIFNRDIGCIVESTFGGARDIVRNMFR